MLAAARGGSEQVNPEVVRQAVGGNRGEKP
jgi:hypothetical protein